MEIDTEREREISHAVRQTVRQVCAASGINLGDLARYVGLAGRQTFYKMRQSPPDAMPTTAVVALLALYDRISYGNNSLAGHIAGILNAEIRTPRHKFRRRGPDPFLSNWWACFEPTAKIDLHDLDAVCQNCTVVLDPDLAASDDFEAEFRPLADALIRAQTYVLVPKTLLLKLKEKADREEAPGVVCGWQTDINYQAAPGRLKSLFDRDLLRVVADDSKDKRALLGKRNAVAQNDQLVFVTDDPDRARAALAFDRKRRRSDRNAPQLRILGIESIPGDHPIEDRYSEWTRKTLRADEPAEYGSEEWREQQDEIKREDDEFFQVMEELIEEKERNKNNMGGTEP